MQKASQTKQRNSSFTPISALYPGMTNYTLKARVTNKTQLRDVASKEANKPSFKMFSCDIIDQDQKEISCTFFGEAAELFHHKIQTEKVYEFSGGVIKLNTNLKYNKKNDYTLTFDKCSTIKEMEDDGNIQLQHFDFVNTEQIKQKSKDEVVDFIGVIANNPEDQMVTLNKSKEQKKKKQLFLYDQSAIKIECILWGEQAERTDLVKGAIVCLKNCRINEFKEVKNLSSGFNTIILVNDQQVPQVTELKQWVQENPNIELVPIGEYQETSKNSSLQVISLKNIEIQCQKLQNEQERLFNTVRVYISFIKQDGKIYYLSCSNPECQKKVTPNDDNTQFTCQIHGTQDSCNAKFMTSIKLADSTGFLWANIYDNQGQDIFGTKANDIKDLVEKENLTSYREMIGNIMYQEYSLTIMSKLENFQNSLKLRHQIIKIQNFKPIQESLNILQQLSLYDQDDIMLEQLM